MLMIGTSDLAERLYVAWRERMEFVDPQRYGKTTNWCGRIVDPPAYKLRPAWSHLTAGEQAVWKHVAEVAAGVIVDAMGAV